MGAWAHHSGRAMGSDVEVLAWGDAPDAPLRWALDEAARLEVCWSRFRADSELARLNASAGRGPFDCSPALWSAVTRAALAWQRTGGLFDPTVHDALVRLGYDRTFRSVLPVAPDAPATTGPAPGFGTVALDPEHRRVTLPAGVALDLGGLGKGLAADVLVAGLVERGATSAEVSMGGDLRVAGPGPDDDGAWWTSVRHPADGRVLFRFPVADEALVQSTRLLRRWQRGGRALHHLVDPRTGWPADTGLDSVVATAPEAWFAEAVAKAVLIAGEDEGLPLAEGLGVDVWCVRADGTVTSTPNVADVVVPAGS